MSLNLSSPLQLLAQARFLATKFEQDSDGRYIDEAIALDRVALDICTTSNQRSACLTQLSFHLWDRYSQFGGIENISEAIILDREALALRQPGHPDRFISLVNLGNALWTRYKIHGSMENLDEAIDFDREALELCPSGHPYRSTTLNNLAIHLTARYEQLHGVEDLSEAVALDRDSLALCPPGHPDRSTSLTNLANHLSTRYGMLGGIDDLEEAILLDREALALRPKGHSGRSITMNNLALHLCARYKQLGGVEDLDQAILLDREALALRPPGHPDRSSSLINLALHLATRYEQLGRAGDLDESIALDRDALVLHPPGHLYRSITLNNLAQHLSTRYKQLGKMEDLDEAIDLDRDALALRPPGHLYRSTTLNNLALHLYIRFERLGGVEDVNGAILLGRDALELRPPGHPDRSSSLSNLAIHLSARYGLFGRLEDLNEAIVLDRESLALRPPGHSNRSSSLSNLALHLYARYERLGGTEDLDKAIVLERDALALRPLGHPDRSSSSNNLAVHLCARYNQLHRMEDLDEAIILNRETLELRPSGHPYRSTSLQNLALYLWYRFERLGSMEDLDEAIILNQDALALRPSGHPERSMTLSNFAVHLGSRYGQRGEVEDLNMAITLDRDALALRPLGHPDRSTSLKNLAGHLFIRYLQLKEEAVQKEILHLYSELANGTQTGSSNDLSAAKAWINSAEYFHHSTTLLAYETAFRLLVQHLAAFPTLPQHLGVLKSLTSSLAVDAFSACLRNQSPTTAVELLEQGRGVFWSQLTRLRSPLDEVIASGAAGKTLAEEFERVTSLIRHALGSPGADQHDRVSRLNMELQGVVSNIRGLPGLSRFLLPLPFSNLRLAASGGPIIILNASKYSCDALVVSVERDPVHIPLSVSKENVQQLSSKLRTLIKRAKTMDMTRDITLFLRELWDQVVSPIANYLRTLYPPQSRVWWCPTAEFSLLPLHAAGPYRKGQQSLSTLFISSYTPTLSALIRARQPSSSTSKSESKRFIAIGQANANGASELFSVGAELANIGQLVDGLATFTRIEGEESCISTVTEELSKNQWVHLACHGLPNRKQPFESAFALHDGHLTVQRIIQCDLRNPEFAYLSACHTTVGDEESPDEVIHLASAMQFAGFRSVVGTMSAVDDAETNKITSMFYKHVVDESGCLDHTRAAYALWKTMKSVKIPLDQRILYIHLGA